MTQHIKPAIGGLNTGHALYSNIQHFFEFGQHDKDLVTDTALTISSAPVIDDPDIGDARQFVTASSVTDTFTVSGDTTVLIVLAARGARLYAGAGLAFVNLNAGDAYRVDYSASSNGRFRSTVRSDFGAYRELYSDAFANDTAFNTGHAFAAHMADTEAMKSCLNGTIGVSTNTGSTNIWSGFSVNLLQGANANDDFSVGAIVIFNKLLSDAELQSVTSDPWALVAETNQAPVLDTPEPDIEIQEDQIWSKNFGANFSDPNTGDTATYSISPDISLVTGFSFDTSTGTASADGTQVAAAGVEYTITRTDSGGLTASDVVIITVVPPALTIDTISDTTPKINTQITVDHSNALGTLTTPNFNIASQTATQAVIDIPDITTFILSGQTYPTINFNTTVAIPLSDGTNSADVNLNGIQPPAGTFFGEITSIPAGSDYENDTGAVVGMFGYFFDISGVLQIDPATGLVMDDGNGGSYSYKLYNGEWGSAVTNTIEARPQGTVSIDSVTPSRNGCVIEFSYPGSDLTGFQYRLDDGAWIAATSPLTLSGLTAETPYDFDITPVNNGRIGDITSTTFTTQTMSADSITSAPVVRDILTDIIKPIIKYF